MKRVALIVATVMTAVAPQGDGIIRLKPREFRQLPPAVREWWREQVLEPALTVQV